MHKKQVSAAGTQADDIAITWANTMITYPGSPIPGISAPVYQSWARGEWAGNDASWFRELRQTRGATR